ncbi:peptide/nickel transport system substrate-binding protein [Thermocatellispora tengchongensis]|uniref:Peptide/nickel transport system substrate-binding protein n=1 Tax=Thermocatellispora tengchongensis TaxID=1073253 RepID=A0A840P329_9ACTN|nr:ABC transporter substrate-binding protein [Thermocatellispora tengchongensis]MBB5133389.1 peptide/nickel transport system substrate-binding protein [Thermocatellispora tengchongensis]
MRPTKRGRLVAMGIAALVSALVLAACGGGNGGGAAAGPQGAPKAGGTLVSGLYLEPLALDPHRQAYWETYRVSSNIFEGLVKEELTDTEGPAKLLPALATKWSVSDGGKVWTFELRKGVRFHDGSEFTAESVDKNVRRVHDPGYAFYDKTSAARLSTWFADLVEGRVVDDHTYEFTFAKPFLGFPRILAQAMSTLTIGNPATWEKYGNDGFADHPSGTGPYTFVSRAIGDRIVLKKNPAYWGPKPYLDELVFRIIPNNQTRLAALLSGEADIISYVQPDDVATLESRGFQVPAGHGAALLYFTFNFKNKAFHDKRVRQAIIQGIDRAQLAKEVYNGNAMPLHSLQPPGNEAYDPQARDFGYDPEGAKALLKEAGYGDGGLSFTIVADVANQNLAEWLQSRLKAIGVNVKVVTLDRPNYVARAFGKPEPDDGLSIDEYGGSYAEWLHQVLYTNIAAKGLDPADFPEIRDAVDEARYTGDEDKRIELWRKADQKVREAAIAIPAVSLTRYYGLGPNVRGFVYAATNWYDLTKVHLAG